MSENRKSYISVPLNLRSCTAYLIELIIDGRNFYVRSELDVPSLLAAIKAAVAELPAEKKAQVQPWLDAQEARHKNSN